MTLNKSLLKSVVLAFVTLQFSEAHKHVLPKFITPCKRFDPKVNECLVKTSNFLKPYLSKGIPEIDFPPIEPFKIPKIGLEQRTNALNFSAVLENIVVTGISSYEFKTFNFNAPNIEWFLEISLGKVDLTGDYNIQGSVLSVPITGKGKFTAGYDSATIEGTHKAQINLKKGVEYLKPVGTKCTIKNAQNPRCNLDGLFEGDQSSSKLVNNVIQDNIVDLFENIRPTIEEVLANIVGQFLFRSLEDNIPYDKLYPKEK